MFFTNSLIGGVNAVGVMPTDINNITYVQLKNGLFDDLYITRDITSPPYSIPPVAWDLDTILHATFNNTTNAGNVDWNLNTVSHVVIKRREESEFKWTTINVQEVKSIEDFNVIGTDYTNASEMNYEYAVVPVLYGAEGVYYSTFVQSHFDGLFLVEKGKIYGTLMTDGYCDTTRNVPSSIVVTINNKYPTYVSNTIANYDSGSCTANFLEITDECEIVTDDQKRNKYQKDIIDFLADRKPKLLKLFDGRIWLVEINNPTNSANGSYNNRDISFEWNEIGDYSSEEDLYITNLSDVTKEWWNMDG